MISLHKSVKNVGFLGFGFKVSVWFRVRGLESFQELGLSASGFQAVSVQDIGTLNI